MANNTEICSIKVTKIIGDYRPGYIKRKIKTHNTGNPIILIISQIPTPAYYISKTNTYIIQPYIQNKYSITTIYPA